MRKLLFAVGLILTSFTINAQTTPIKSGPFQPVEFQYNWKIEVTYMDYYSFQFYTAYSLDIQCATETEISYTRFVVNEQYIISKPAHVRFATMNVEKIGGPCMFTN